MIKNSIKILLSTSLISFNLSAEIMNLEKGWNLVGFPTLTKAEDILSKNDLVDNIYFFESGEWKENGEIASAKGVWLHLTENAQLEIKESERVDLRIDELDLEKGWNLLSLPINSAISPKIFENAISVWRYSGEEDGWQIFSDQYSSEEFPKIDVLGKGEGFWVNSTLDETIFLNDKENELTNFKSENEMLTYLSSLIRFNRSYRGNEPIFHVMYGAIDDGMILELEDVADSIPVSIPVEEDTAVESTATNSNASKGEEGGSVDNATTTNLQETGVDEADIVKHDGKNIFYVGNWGTENGIYINTFDRLLNEENKYLTKIDTDINPEELYLIDNKLIAIFPYSNNFWNSWEDISVWSESSKIQIYDVTDINNISKTDEYVIDGNIVDSRVTNNNLYLVTRFMPFIEVEYPKTYIEDCVDEYPYNKYYEDNEASTDKIIKNDDNNIDIAIEDERVGIAPYPYPNDVEYCWWYAKDDTGYFKYDYENPIFGKEHLKPVLTDKINDKENEILSAENLYAPYKFDQSPFITSVISFDLEDVSQQKTVSIVGNSDTLYVSNNAIYSVARTPIYYGWYDQKDRSSIYKFSIKDDDISYKGRGFVDGYILNQFSLSEYKDTLRVATTVGGWWSDTDNIIYTLQENEIENILDISGKLDGLGHDGETIKGVRFLADKGFIVTFKQTDPLYTIDLSDPYNPKKVGELKIPGFSSYFHPVDENRILSIGQDADEETGRTKGVQIQLFDISDFANPILADKLIIGEDWRTRSEAVWNHKAFTYRNSDDMFAIPISQEVEIEKNIDDNDDSIGDIVIKPMPVDEKDLETISIENSTKIEETSEDVVEIINNTADTISSILPTVRAVAINDLETKEEENTSAEVSVTTTELPTEEPIDGEIIKSDIKEDYYYPSWIQKNYLGIYQVNDMKIESISKVNGSDGYNSGYQRGIIFSKDSKDYAIYVKNAELFLEEVVK